MATAPMPSPDQGAAPPSPAGGGGSAPDQGSQPQSPQSPTSAPASQLQLLLNRWYQAAKQMAAADPRLASGANKVAEGVQEMQSSLVTPPQPTPMTQQPQY
jgi:X-X-X-Leu-X-X-Gly heptad repeat protein